MPRDLDAVKAIVAAAYSPYIPRMGREPGPMSDDYAALIAAGRVHVAEVTGIVVGLLVLMPRERSLLLDNIAVDPSVAGEGFGRALLEFAETSAHAAGFRTLSLYTHETMTENVALYARIGFVETHRAEENGFHRVFMSKHLAG